MLPFLGYIREKLGRTVNTAVLLMNVGTYDSPMEVLEPVQTLVHDYDNHGNFVLDDQKMPKLHSEVHLSPVIRSVKRIHYRKLAQIYYLPPQQFWVYDENHAFLLKPENEAIGRGEVHVEYIDYDTGAHLTFGGVYIVPDEAEPTQLRRAIHTQHIAEFVRAHSQVILTMILIGCCIGGLFGFILGQNATTISHALSHVKLKT